MSFQETEIGVSGLAIPSEVTLGGALQINSEPEEVVLITDYISQGVIAEVYKEEVQTYTDAQLAEEFGLTPGGINLIKSFFGIETDIFTKDDADRIKEHIKKCENVQKERSQIPEGFIPLPESAETVKKIAKK